MEKMMLSRREWLSLTLATGAAAALDRTWVAAQQPLITRGVPASGERLPSLASAVPQRSRKSRADPM
jgi:hypothetical protein